MSKYKIAVKEGFNEHMIVEADSEDEAIEKALLESTFADPLFDYVVEAPTNTNQKQGE